MSRFYLIRISSTPLEVHIKVRYSFFGENVLTDIV